MDFVAIRGIHGVRHVFMIVLLAALMLFCTTSATAAATDADGFHFTLTPDSVSGTAGTNIEATLSVGCSRGFTLYGGQYTLTLDATYLTPNIACQNGWSSGLATHNGITTATFICLHGEGKKIDASETVARIQLHLKKEGITTLNAKTAILTDANGVARTDVTATGASLTIMDDSSTTGFHDVPTSHWAAADIDHLVQLGIINGTSATTFEPNTAITRANFVTILGRYGGLADSSPSYPAESLFKDVPIGAYYASHVVWAARQNIVIGVGDKNFAPQHQLTRQNMACLLYRFADTTGYSFQQNTDAIHFADETKIAGYAQTSVHALQLAGVIKGYAAHGQSCFRPTTAPTRAEAAAMISRLLTLLEEA